MKTYKDVDLGKTAISARIKKEIIDEIEEIASHLFANKTAILQECLRLGLEEFKKQKPELVEMIRILKRKKEQSKHLKKTAI